jgi:hypothetical protein
VCGTPIDDTLAHGLATQVSSFISTTTAAAEACFIIESSVHLLDTCVHYTSLHYTSQADRSKCTLLLVHTRAQSNKLCMLHVT